MRSAPPAGAGDSSTNVRFQFVLNNLAGLQTDAARNLLKRPRASLAQGPLTSSSSSPKTRASCRRYASKS